MIDQTSPSDHKRYAFLIYKKFFNKINVLSYYLVNTITEIIRSPTKDTTRCFKGKLLYTSSNIVLQIKNDFQSINMDMLCRGEAACGRSVEEWANKNSKGHMQKRTVSSFV